MIRILLNGILALILALASPALAVGQHASAGGMTLVLCTDGGEIAVTLDAQGNEVPAAGHVCPDCVAAMAAQAVPAGHALPMPPLGTQVLYVATRAQTAAGQKTTPPQARGPPLML